MHFGTKSYLKSTRNHTVKHAQNVQLILPTFFLIFFYIIKTWVLFFSFWASGYSFTCREDKIYLHKKIWGFDFKKSGLDFWHLGI